MPRDAPIYFVKKKKENHKKQPKGCASHELNLLRTHNTLSKYSCIDIQAPRPTFDDYEHGMEK